MNEELYEVKCPKRIRRDVTAVTAVPGSKSITNRALLLAAMADGRSTLRGCLTSDDAVHFLECLKTLGFPAEVIASEELGSDIVITGYGGEIPKKSAEIYVGSAGTAARFLVAMLAFSDGEYTVRSSEQMKKRPMRPLIDALRDAGAEVVCMEEEGHFPLHIAGARGRSRIPDHFTVNIEKSSQFLSALLIAVGTLGKKAEITVAGTHGLSYVRLTAEMMKRFGVTPEETEADGRLVYRFSGEGGYRALEYEVEPDLSAAAYFYALAAVLGARTAVKGVKRPVLQGDAAFLNVLEQMGCTVCERDGEAVTVVGPKDGRLRGGFCVDLSAFSDQALTLAAIAPFADAPITITGVGHIRFQECDRIRAIVENLTALGIRVEERQDGAVIYPGVPQGCEIETYDDHRVAMAFALTGLRTDGVRIRNPRCCKKTFAEYFTVLEQTLAFLEDRD